MGNRIIQRLVGAAVQREALGREEEQTAQLSSLNSSNAGLAQLQAKAPEEDETLRTKPLVQRGRDAHSTAPRSLEDNRTGLPESLRAGIETLSEIAMDDVKVHRNSSKPAAVRALAYTQGTSIYLGPGQERHLPHEAWHVVQQKQGRVKPTLQLKGAAINDDPTLENEADVMGQRALSIQPACDSSDPSACAEGVASGSTVQVIQPMWDNEGSNDDDHAEGYSEEETIDWSELTQQATRLPQWVLFNIFYNLAEDYYRRADKRMPGRDAFLKPFIGWMIGGVFTRARFKQLIGIPPAMGDDTNKSIIQRARTGNTYSRNGGYQGASNSHNYDEVIYYRDGGGNIGFETDPIGIVANFNSTETPAVVPGNVKWKDPVDHNSLVQMNNDLTDKHKGVMPSGKSVNLPSASRAQHFAVADMLYPNIRGGKFTWHHLTAKYYMILVDMRVHAKHGHNGGVHLWK
ncbi:MAG TPA: DUF4157 domain-containing protein [Blastocatellia bacterium]|nr:DUF4157 domain-containing protein [Blastocatellia bacterium]